MKQFECKPRQKKSLGQVFLRHKHVIENLVKSINLSPDNILLEIGGGDGRVSEELVKKVERLLIVEIDDQYVEILSKKFENDTRVTILPGDILSEEILSKINENLAGRKLSVYGSIPYYITTPILKWVLKNRNIIQAASLLMQQEVARRVVAPHGNKEYGYLSVIMQLSSDVSLGPVVSRKDFSPIPNVDSQVLNIGLDMAPFANDQFERMVSALFQQRRKQIGNSLKGFLGAKGVENLKNECHDVSMYLSARPEQFSPGELLQLYNIAVKYI